MSSPVLTHNIVERDREKTPHPWGCRCRSSATVDIVANSINVLMNEVVWKSFRFVLLSGVTAVSVTIDIMQ